MVGNKHGSVDKMHTIEQAVYGRNAFAKVSWSVGLGGGDKNRFCSVSGPVLAIKDTFLDGFCSA